MPMGWVGASGFKVWSLRFRVMHVALIIASIVTPILLFVCLLSLLVLLLS